MTLRGLAEEIAEDIRERLEEYLMDREMELVRNVRAGVQIDRKWSGYLITIAGHTITAEHDSSAHRWKFIVQEGIYEEFFSISEKKGQAIVDFLKALSRAINPSVAAVDQGEENLAAEHFKKSSQELQDLPEEIGGGCGK
ncbi:MAG: hypothetical protein GXO25_05935 [Euryarchaeota archaeon]|nr:hypothetical protein [Euryarchaeota archaeon]